MLLLGFALPLWGKRVNGDIPATGDRLAVHAVAEQFAWNFHYPGPDGIFGRQHDRLITRRNPLGIDAERSRGKDDIVSKNELHLVNHKPTVDRDQLKDVIHGFSLQHMRIHQDAIPGNRNPACGSARS